MGALSSSPSGPLHLTTTGTLFHSPNASYTCPKFQLVLTGGIEPWTLYALNDSILLSHLADPTAAAIRYIGASSYRNVDFPSATDWTAGTSIDFFVVDGEKSTAITSSTMVLEFDEKKCKMGETELSWGEQWRIAGFVFLTMGVIFGVCMLPRYLVKRRQRAELAAAQPVELAAGTSHHGRLVETVIQVNLETGEESMVEEMKGELERPVEEEEEHAEVEGELPPGYSPQA